MGDDGVAEEVIALLGAIAVEALDGCEVVDGGMHGLDDGGDERTGHVTDAHLDELSLGMGLLVGRGAACDLGEEVTAGKLGVVEVYVCHERPPERNPCLLRCLDRCCGPVSRIISYLS